MRSIAVSLPLAIFTAVALAATSAQLPPLPVDEIRPGMVGVGRTVYAGSDLEEFQVTILGVMRNVVGPRRDLVLARLDGGPLAHTGVIRGMSGSPVYIDGRLIGAVSYSLGSFPKEPIAGITPIAEMIDDVDSRVTRTSRATPNLTWPASPAQVFEALAEVAKQAASPLGRVPAEARIVGPGSLADLAPSLRPIGAAFTLAGFDDSIGRRLSGALDTPVHQSPATSSPIASTSAPLRPGDPVGMSLVRGDFQMGATGTVTHIDGSRVYAFGHPFLNLGSTRMAMTEAHVVTVLPSLDASMKLASMGSVIGTITQDRATAVGGVLGEGPSELDVQVNLRSSGGHAQRFEFAVLNDPALTPLFTYAALLNAFAAYERQFGVMSLTARGTLSFGDAATIDIDDVFSGNGATVMAAASIASPVGTLMGNEFRTVTATSLTVDIDTTEVEEYSTIERVWLDTNRPAPGGAYHVQIQLRDYRGGTRVVEVPVTIPTHVTGSVKLLVADASMLATVEQRDLHPVRPASWDELVKRTNTLPRSNRIYVRLLADSAGAVLGGETLPSLPASVHAIVQSDATTERVAVSRNVLGAWEHRLDRVVRGSRELTLKLEPAR